VRFGRKRPVAVHPHLKLKNYLRASLPPAPTSCDYSSSAMAVLSDILGNDQLGDCVIAGGYHVTGVETGNAGDLFHPTLDQIVQDYSAIGGYVPGDSSTDNGCDLQTAMAYWTQTGFKNGTKLLGYLAVDASNAAEIQSALYLFENLYLGLELPDSYVNPFPASDGFTWDVGQPDPANGHCIMGLGYDTSGVKIDTWGLLGTFTWRALAALCSAPAGGEAWVMLTPDQLTKGQSRAPNGVDWSSLLADWDSMGGNVPVGPPPAPPPAPPTPPVPPTPGASPTLDEAVAAVTAALEAMHPLMTRSQAESAAVAALAQLWPAP
jgi:hypothetical protein